MAYNPRRLPLTFEKGVFQAYEDSDVPDGFATQLENWEPLPSGGLRVRSGWLVGPTGIATPKIIGIDYQSGWQKYIVVHQNGATYTIYYTAIVEPGAWDALVSLGTMAAADTDPSFVTSAMHGVDLILGGPGLDKLYKIDSAGVLTNASANVPTKVRALEEHNNSLWAGGGFDRDGNWTPYRLMWTAPGANPLAAWPANNYIDIGLDAQSPITALATFRDYLLIGKTDSVWLLHGAPPNVDLHRLDEGDAGRGRAIVAVPQGAVVCGKKDIWLYDGGTMNRISEPLWNDYIGLPRVYASPFESKVYILAEGKNRMFVFDPEGKTWRTDVLPEDMQMLTMIQGAAIFARQRLMAGPVAGSAVHSFVQRYAGGNQQARDFDAWTETFKLRTPEYRAQEQGTFRHLELRFRQRNGNPAQEPLALIAHTRQADGSIVDRTYSIKPRNAGDEWVERIDLPGTAYGVKFELTHSVPVGQTVMFDLIEAPLLFFDDPGPR